MNGRRSTAVLLVVSSVFDSIQQLHVKGFSMTLPAGNSAKVLVH